jgi:hypothetical protein
MGERSGATSEADGKRHAVVVTANDIAGLFENTNQCAALIERAMSKLQWILRKG